MGGADLGHLKEPASTRRSHDLRGKPGDAVPWRRKGLPYRRCRPRPAVRKGDGLRGPALELPRRHRRARPRAAPLRQGHHICRIARRRGGILQGQMTGVGRPRESIRCARPRGCRLLGHHGRELGKRVASARMRRWSRQGLRRSGRRRRIICASRVRIPPACLPRTGWRRHWAQALDARCTTHRIARLCRESGCKKCAWRCGRAVRSPSMHGYAVAVGQECSVATSENLLAELLRSARETGGPPRRGAPVSSSTRLYCVGHAPSDRSIPAG